MKATIGVKVNEPARTMDKRSDSSNGSAARIDGTMDRLQDRLQRATAQMIKCDGSARSGPNHRKERNGKADEANAIHRSPEASIISFREMLLESSRPRRATMPRVKLIESYKLKEQSRRRDKRKKKQANDRWSILRRLEVQNDIDDELGDDPRLFMASLAISDILEITNGLERGADQFLDNFQRWYEQLTAPFEKLESSEWSSTDSTFLLRAALLGLCRLLPAAAEFQSIARELSATKIQALLKILIKCPPWFDRWALLGVYTCMKFFPDASKRNFSNTVAPFAERCLRSGDRIVQRQAADCVALFALMTGQTRRSSAWNRQLETILYAYHDSLLRSFEPLVVHDERCPMSTKPKTDVTGENDGADVLRVVSRLSLVTDGKEQAMDNSRIFAEILRSMFSEYDDYVVTVNVQLVADLFSCFVGSLEKMKTPAEDLIEAAIDLTSLISERVVPAVGVAAVPFAQVFVDNAIHLLRVSRMESSALIRSVFTLLASLARYVGPAALPAFQRIVSKSLEYTEQILRRDSVASTTTKLESSTPSADPESSKRKAQKRKAILMEEMSVDRYSVATKGKHSPGTADVFKECFRAWKVILETGGSFIHGNDFRRLQQLVCRLILPLQNTADAANDVVISDAGCRCELYELFAALTACPHPTRPSTLQCAIGIFETGLRRDSDPTVISACRNGLAVCALMAKPRLPYMEDIVIEEQQMDDQQEEKTVTEKLRPRAANASIFEPLATTRDPSPLLTFASDKPSTSANNEENITKTESSANGKRVITDKEWRTNPEPIAAVCDKDEIEVIATFSAKGLSKIPEVELVDPENTELDSMLGDFVDTPAETIDVYID